MKESVDLEEGITNETRYGKKKHRSKKICQTRRVD